MNIFEALKKAGYTTTLNDTWEMMEDQDAWTAKICKQYPAIADMISQNEKDYDSRKAAASNWRPVGSAIGIQCAFAPCR